MEDIISVKNCSVCYKYKLDKYYNNPNKNHCLNCAKHYNNEYIHCPYCHSTLKYKN